MRKLAIIALAVAAFAARAADMASQKWVELKLDELVEDLKMMDIVKATQPLAFRMGTNGTLYASFARRTEYALSVTNSANAVVTNGALFAWAGNGVYTNAQLASAVFATKTNFVWNGIGSTVADGRCFFAVADGFGVTGVRLTQEEARKVKGE